MYFTKFRGIVKEDSVENGSWVCGNLKLPLLDCGDYTIQDFSSGLWYVVNPKTIGQSTGIKDINNKTIFAGDIVNYKYEKYDERNDVPYLASHVGKVELVGCLCSFRIKPICNVLETCRANSLSLTEPDKADNEYIEIIGNIHNNPELLDEQ